jgi:hypothetical protein
LLVKSFHHSTLSPFLLVSSGIHRLPSKLFISRLVPSIIYALFILKLEGIDSHDSRKEEQPLQPIMTQYKFIADSQ